MVLTRWKRSMMVSCRRAGVWSRAQGQLSMGVFRLSQLLLLPSIYTFGSDLYKVTSGLELSFKNIWTLCNQLSASCCTKIHAKFIFFENLCFIPRWESLRCSPAEELSWRWTLPFHAYLLFAFDNLFAPSHLTNVPRPCSRAAQRWIIFGVLVS